MNTTPYRPKEMALTLMQFALGLLDDAGADHPAIYLQQALDLLECGEEGEAQDVVARNCG